VNRYKSIFTSIAVVFCLGSITCDNGPAGPDPDVNTDAGSVAADKNALAITYTSGDNASSVTGNVGLPASGANGSSVTWVTSNSSHITAEGTVSRPDAGNDDASVTLTATISKGVASDTKVFSLTVKAIGSSGTGGSVTDIDGNVYTTVKIGTQEWTVENLRTTKYNDGSAIPHVTDDSAWDGLTSPGYCWHDNDISYKSKYGALYNWYAIGTEKLAPTGWHVPTDADWTVLENYLILNGYNWDGTTTGNKIAKSLAAKTDWASDGEEGTVGTDLESNNRTGFSALPGGCRRTDGSFSLTGYSVYWWSSTDEGMGYADYRDIQYSWEHLSKYDESKRFGCFVRLLKD
jgi:uncharacterized protein (TIGR02145 family)